MSVSILFILQLGYTYIPVYLLSKTIYISVPLSMSHQCCAPALCQGLWLLSMIFPLNLQRHETDVLSLPLGRDDWNWNSEHYLFANSLNGQEGTKYMCIVGCINCTYIYIRVCVSVLFTRWTNVLLFGERGFPSMKLQVRIIWVHIRRGDIAIWNRQPWHPGSDWS